MKLCVRPMRESDVPAVLDVERHANPHPWNEQQLRDEFDQPSARLYVATTDGNRLAGYLVVWHVLDELHIQNVATHPAFRRQGVAKALLAEAVREAAEGGCTSAHLEVRASNGAAQSLYRALGFEPVGRRPRYYAPNGEDAVLMSAAVLKDGCFGHMA